MATKDKHQHVVNDHHPLGVRFSMDDDDYIPTAPIAMDHYRNYEGKTVMAKEEVRYRDQAQNDEGHPTNQGKEWHQSDEKDGVRDNVTEQHIDHLNNSISAKKIGDNTSWNTNQNQNHDPAASTDDLKKQIFMPQISELLCQGTLLEDFAPELLQTNKSRNIQRRHLSIAAMQSDVENLKKYLQHQFKSTPWGDRSSSSGENFTMKDLKKKSKKSKERSFCGILVSFVACLLCLPCVLLECCTRKLKSVQIGILEPQEEVTIIEDYDYFWDPVDIEEMDCVRYQSAVKEVLSDWMQTRNPQSWDKMDKELAEICINNYTNRLKVWLDLYASEGCEMQRDMFGQGLKMMQLSYSSGSNEVIHQLIKSRHPIVGLKKFHTGLYQGTTPLHLAIINKSIAATNAILEANPNDQVYELMHLRAISTPLQNIFPTIELPLNLAVWMGDANVVITLVEKGAEMCLQDEDGNNPMHVVALLAEEDPEKAVRMLEVLLDLVEVWLEKTTECKALQDLSLKKGNLVALYMLFKCQNKQGLTPLKLAAKSGCLDLVQRILNIDKVYRFPLYKLGPKSESLYDYSEIDPLLAPDAKTVSVLEMLVFEEDDHALDILGLPLIAAVKEVKERRMRIVVFVAMTFHVLFMTLHSLSCYNWLLPQIIGPAGSQKPNNTDVSHRFTMQEVDIVILIIGCMYMLLLLLAGLNCLQITRRMRLGLWNITFIVSSIQMPSIAGFSISLILYFVLKAMENDYEVYMLSLSMFFGWIYCLYFTRAFRSTSFFALMMHRVLVADIIRFLSIIGIIVLAFTMMTSALLMTDLELQEDIEEDNDKTNLDLTSPVAVMFDFFQLASGIADFTLLQKSTSWFFCGLIYVVFLILANILLFNLLIASMSTRYAVISGNGELLCRKVMVGDIVVWECMMPGRLRRTARNIYQHRVVRIRLNANDAARRRRRRGMTTEEGTREVNDIRYKGNDTKVKVNDPKDMDQHFLENSTKHQGGHNGTHTSQNNAFYAMDEVKSSNKLSGYSNNEAVLENHVYLLRAPDFQHTLHWKMMAARQRSIVP